MKNNPITALALLLTFLFSGCSTVHYAVHRDPFTLPDSIGYMKLDTTYDLFVRTVSVEEKPTGQNKQITRALKINLPAAQLRSDSSSGKLIEIEYLFLSYAHHRVLYISTVADRYKDRYAGADFQGISKPNIADFRVFLVGSTDPENLEKFIFYKPDGKHTDTWWLRKEKHSGDRLLYNIEQKRFASFEASFPLEDDLAGKLVFKKQSRGWQVIFRETGNTAPPQAIPAPLIIFGRTGKTNYSIAFRLKDSVVTFPGRFMIYRPEMDQ